MNNLLSEHSLLAHWPATSRKAEQNNTGKTKPNTVIFIPNVTGQNIYSVLENLLNDEILNNCVYKMYFCIAQNAIVHQKIQLTSSPIPVHQTTGLPALHAERKHYNTSYVAYF